MRIPSTSFSDFLRGSQHPTALWLAVVGGTLLGFTTGFNLTFLVLLLAALLLNLRSQPLAICWAIFATVAWWCRPAIEAVGRLTLDETPLGSLIARLGDGPVVALLAWDQYAVVGGLLVALAVCLPLGKIISLWNQHQRTRAATSQSSATATANWNPLRPGALWVGGLLLLASGPLAATFGPAYLEHHLLAELSRANRAEVTAGDLSLGWFDGQLTMNDVRFGDPQNLATDRLQVAQLTAQIDVGALLRGYLEVEALHLHEVRPGHVAYASYEEPLTHYDSTSNSNSPRTNRNGSVPTLRLEDYLAHWPRRTTTLNTLGQLVQQLERLACHESTNEPSARTTSDTTRSTLGRQRPHWHIKSLKADQLARSWGLGRRALLEVSNLSSDPQTSVRATTLKLVAPELGTEIDATLTLRGVRPRHEVNFRSFDLPLAQLLDSSHSHCVVATRGGQLSLRGEGWVDRQQLNVAVQFEATELDAHCTGTEPLAGLRPDTWNEGLRRLNSLRADALLCGTWQEPRLAISEPQLVGQFKHQLRAARQHNLVRAIEAELADEQLATHTPATAAQPTPPTSAAEPTSSAKPRASAQAPRQQLAQAVEPRVTDQPTTPAKPDRYANYRTAASAHQPATTPPNNDPSLYAKMVESEAVVAQDNSVCAGCTTDANDQLPHDEPGTPIGQPVSATLVESSYPTTDTPYDDSSYPSVPISYPTAQSAVAQMSVGPAYDAQTTSLVGLPAAPRSEPPLPGPVDMQTGYDPLRMDQIIESQLAAAPTSTTTVVAPETRRTAAPPTDYVLVDTPDETDTATDQQDNLPTNRASRGGPRDSWRVPRISGLSIAGVKRTNR